MAKNSKKNSKTSKIIKRSTTILSLVLLSGITIGVSGGTYLIHKESINARKIKLNPSQEKLTQNLTITDINDQVLATTNEKVYYDPAKITGGTSNISDIYLKTLVAVEDNTFYSRKTKGFDIKGIANAGLSFIKSKLGKGDIRGGSTIDQQLVKNLVLGGSKADESISRKVVEVIDSHEMAKNYSRDKILETYINTIRLTPNTIGVNAAWQSLFDGNFKQDSKDPLYIAQLAYTAGLGQNPSLYIQNFDTYGKKRTKTILGVMKDSGIISEKLYKDAIKATSERLKLKSQVSMHVPVNYQPYISQVNIDLKKLNLPTYSNLKIKTYADKNKLDELAKIAKFEAQPVTSASNQTKPDGILTGISVIDTNTGHILGIATNDSNPLTPITSQRSSGSSIKPIIDYIPALEYGLISPNSILNGNNSSYSDGTPLSNYGNYNYGNVNASFALGESLNGAAHQVFMMTSDLQKNSIMRPLGIAKPSYEETESIGYNISTLQEASAYQAIGNDGVHIEPTTIANIKMDNTELKLPEQKKERSMSSRTSSNIIQMLQNVTNANGSEPDAAHPQWANAFATKSGTVGFDATTTAKINSNAGVDTMPASDSWLVATTSGVSVSTWMGTPDFSGNSYIISGGPLGQNKGRVYLLNNTLALMNPSQLKPFTHSGDVLRSPLTTSLTIPNVPNPVNESALSPITGFNEQLPTIDKSLQEFYDKHKTDTVIDPNTIYDNTQ